MLFCRPCVTGFTDHQPILRGLTSFCAQFNRPLSISNVNCSRRRFRHKRPFSAHGDLKEPSSLHLQLFKDSFIIQNPSQAPRLGAGPCRPSPPPLTNTLIGVSLGSVELIYKSRTADNDFAALGEGDLHWISVVVVVMLSRVQHEHLPITNPSKNWWLNKIAIHFNELAALY